MSTIHARESATPPLVLAQPNPLAAMAEVVGMPSRKSSLNATGRKNASKQKRCRTAAFPDAFVPANDNRIAVTNKSVTPSSYLLAQSTVRRQMAVLAFTLGFTGMPLHLPGTAAVSPIVPRKGSVTVAVDTRLPWLRRIENPGDAIWPTVTVLIPSRYPNEYDGWFADALRRASDAVGVNVLLLNPGSGHGPISLKWYWAIYAFTPFEPIECRTWMNGRSIWPEANLEQSAGNLSVSARHRATHSSAAYIPAFVAARQGLRNLNMMEVA